MKEMQRIVNDPAWKSKMQCKWNMVKSKIIDQGALEAPHKTRLRNVLEGITQSGK